MFRIASRLTLFNTEGRITTSVYSYRGTILPERDFCPFKKSPGYKSYKLNTKTFSLPQTNCELPEELYCCFFFPLPLRVAPLTGLRLVPTYCYFLQINNRNQRNTEHRINSGINWRKCQSEFFLLIQPFFRIAKQYCKKH